MKAAVYARLALASLCLLALATSASAGIVVGNEWRVRPAREREAYVVGTIDGWQIVDATIQEPAKRLPVGAFKILMSCAQDRRMTGHQMFAIVEKYMAGHPEEWHQAMASIVFNAMIDVCK
jgi:hypothetical protein